MASERSTKVNVNCWRIILSASFIARAVKWEESAHAAKVA